MKIVFDTNVYVSEALVGGLAERIIDATAKERWRIYVSTFILDETQRVLTEQLGFRARLASLTRQRIRRRCEPIEPPPSRHEVPRDANDSPILRAALAAGASFLVTDDRHLLELNPYEGLRIISMREFADVLRSEGLLSE
jgi:putative PIN family toxin of toxin-antitoxin system